MLLVRVGRFVRLLHGAHDLALSGLPNCVLDCALSFDVLRFGFEFRVKKIALRAFT